MDAYHIHISNLDKCPKRLQPYNFTPSFICKNDKEAKLRVLSYYNNEIKIAKFFGEDLSELKNYPKLTEFLRKYDEKTHSWKKVK